MENVVMIIEDELIIAHDLAQLLQSSGYKVVGIAKNSDQALAIFNQHEVHLILCDINIQGEKDGIETIKMLTKNKKVAVIYISAYSDANTGNRAIETSPAAFLIKPYNERNLQLSIELALHKLNESKKINDADAFHLLFSKREWDIIHEIQKGKTSQQIADDLFISKLTVEKHRSNILKKADCKSATELISLLYQKKMID
ncbi:MAG: response regulator [Cyclobacteriaceae bacterium]|nr:response regulator [Cyclobacteriaceae bacterium]